MSKGFDWMFILVFCFVALTLHFIYPRDRTSTPQAIFGQPLDAETQNSTRLPQPDARLAQPGDGSLIQTSSAIQTPGPDIPSAQISNSPAEQGTVINHGGALPRQDAARQAEILSYPPEMQETASNHFVLAMTKLTKAHTEFERYVALGDAAKSEFLFGKFEGARNFATELLALDEKFKGDPARDGEAVYTGNLILGRLAVQEGKMDEAREYLLASGTTSGSAVLGSFGPNMSLARDLLQNGERNAVLEFFERCRKFWAAGDDKLTLWSEDVAAGRMPDFGPNLAY